MASLGTVGSNYKLAEDVADFPFLSAQEAVNYKLADRMTVGYPDGHHYRLADKAWTLYRGSNARNHAGLIGSGVKIR